MELVGYKCVQVLCVGHRCTQLEVRASMASGLSWVPGAQVGGQYIAKRRHWQWREIKHSACGNWGGVMNNSLHTKSKGFTHVLPVHSDMKCACVSVRMFKWAQHLAGLWQCFLRVHTL